MGAARKLQQEIDAVLKKVKEGISTFDDTYEKLIQNQSPQQREKLVASLKDQIKKLQKDRDKIKTWASDKDVRDKQTLADARAMIERRMERFKECEKDMKVKDFSKVGLEKGNKLDPKQVAIEERREWIRTCVEQISNTVEMNEAEMENIRAALKRSKEPPPRVARIQERNAMHKKHQERLEQVLRALDNEALSIDQVDTLKDSIEDYLENGNASDDDGGFYDDVDALYEEEVLTIIGNVDVHVPMVGDRALPRIPEVPEKVDKKGRDAKDVDKAVREKDREKVTAGLRAGSASSSTIALSPQQAVLDDKPGTASPVQVPVIKEPPPPPPPRSTQPVLTSPKSASIQATPQSPSMQSTASDPAVNRPGTGGAGIAWVAQDGDMPGTPGSGAAGNAAPSGVPANGQSAGAGGGAGMNGAPPPGLAPKAMPHQAAQHAPSEGATVAPVIEPGSLMMMLQDKRPHPFDGVWHRYACARRTRTMRPCPASYPRVPLAILDMPKFYSSIPKDNDLDLFTIFYLTPGTQYQYLAACELRQRNWRYHKEQKAWFQRAEPPSERTPTYERGDYIYFDSTISESDDSWVFRLKKDFTVEYSQVEGDAWCEDYSVIGMA